MNAYVVVAVGGMALCGTVGFIFGWLQGRAEPALQQADRLYAEKQFNESRGRLVQPAGPYCMGMDCVCGAGPCPANRAAAQDSANAEGK